MSHIILPPGFILPPGLILPPYYFTPWKLYNDLHYLPMSYIIFPLDLPPYHFSTVSFCPLESNCLMIYTIYACPVSFCPLDWTLGARLLSFNRMLGQILRCSDFTIVMFLFVLRFHTNKKPFRTKAYDRRASSDCGTSGASY